MNKVLKVNKDLFDMQFEKWHLKKRKKTKKNIIKRIVVNIYWYVFDSILKNLS